VRERALKRDRERDRKRENVKEREREKEREVRERARESLPVHRLYLWNRSPGLRLDDAPCCLANLAHVRQSRLDHGPDG
jgi:hypothetical protein